MAEQVQPKKKKVNLGKIEFKGDAMDDKILDQMKNLSLDHKDKISEDLNSVLHQDAQGYKLSDFVTKKGLGKGAFGEVDLVIHQQSQKQFAMKKIKVLDDEQFKKQLSWELKALLGCDSPNVVKYYGAFYDGGIVYILLEYMDQGSLDTVMKKAKSEKQAIPEPVLGWITYQTLLGLRYLNKDMKVIHRDIKPANILINSQGQVKLCDLGICGKLQKTLEMRETFVGTTIYMSPERLIGNPYNVATDIWSLGITLIECKQGSHPLTVSGKTEFWDMLQLITTFEVPTLPEGTHEVFTDFVKKCCIQDQSQRPTADELLAHKLVKKQAQSPEKFQEMVASWLSTI